VFDLYKRAAENTRQKYATRHAETGASVIGKVPAPTQKSRQMLKALKARATIFVGLTVLRAHLQESAWTKLISEA